MFLKHASAAQLASRPGTSELPPLPQARSPQRPPCPQPRPAPARPAALPRGRRGRAGRRQRRVPSRDVAAAGRAAARLRGRHGRPLAAVVPAERGAGAQVGAGAGGGPGGAVRRRGGPVLRVSPCSSPPQAAAVPVGPGGAAGAGRGAAGLRAAARGRGAGPLLCRLPLQAELRHPRLQPPGTAAWREGGGGAGGGMQGGSRYGALRGPPLPPVPDQALPAGARCKVGALLGESQLCRDRRRVCPRPSRSQSGRGRRQPG